MNTDISALQHGFSVISDPKASLRDVSSSRAELVALKGSLEVSVSDMRANPETNISTIGDQTTGTPVLGGSIGGGFGVGFNSAPGSTNLAIGTNLAKEAKQFIDIGRMSSGIPQDIQLTAGSALLGESIGFLEAANQEGQQGQTGQIPQPQEGVNENKNNDCCCPCSDEKQKPEQQQKPEKQQKPQSKPKENNNEEDKKLIQDIQDCINKLDGKEGEVKDKDSAQKPTQDKKPESKKEDDENCCECKCDGPNNNEDKIQLNEIFPSSNGKSGKREPGTVFIDY